MMRFNNHSRLRNSTWRLAACWIGWLIASASYAAERPNIITILADDMGYSDIGCYGGEIDTPNLNRLAEGGVRFSNFYNAARCCPTRASLLSGLYPHQAGVGWMMADNGYPGYEGELNRRCVTMAEVLSRSGYRTYMAGKWHVTSRVNPKAEKDKANWPLQRGFDRFYGTIHGAGSFFDPFSLTRDNQYISPEQDPEYDPVSGFYYTDAISDHAIRYIEDHDQDFDAQPFFMYVSYTAAHWPMHARPGDIEKYKGKYDASYETVRQQRMERLRASGLVDPSAVTLPSMEDSWKETEHLDWDIRNMEVYAAMVDSMDQGIGRIVDALRRTHQLDNTIILYLQDNGGCAENYGRSGEAKPRADAPTLPVLAADYLQPDMQPKQTRDGYPVRTGKGVMAGGADTYIAYGRGWATVSNTPFREYKHWVHEGGIATPLIMHWPNGLKNSGTICHTPGHLVDIMATVVDASGANYPSAFHGGSPIRRMEGISLLPAARGSTTPPRPIFWEHEGNRAVRLGNYKLVAKGAAGAWELYDLSKDRSEQRDLSAQQPARVAALARLWFDYARRAQVLPLTPYSAKKSKPSFKQTSKLLFRLKPDSNLQGEDAPYIEQRGVEFSAKLSAAEDGVVIAQGGGSYGWAVYIKDKKPTVAWSRGGKRTTLVANEQIAGAGLLSFRWLTTGQATLQWNGRVVASLQEVAPLDKQPADGLQIGKDLAGSVGDYEGEYPYPATISSIKFRLLP